MDDQNLVLLEGTIIGSVDEQVTGDTRALNFTIESKKGTRNGDKFFRHQIVVWNKTATEVCEKVKNGVYVRIRGHLQQSQLVVGEGDTAKVVYFDKACADFIEIAE